MSIRGIVSLSLPPELRRVHILTLLPVIFGQESVYCPSAGDCYCNVYGLCDLECERDDHCEGQYTLPPYATLPDGWPRIGWQGEERNFSGPL